MANTEMIRDYIRASGYKMQYVARALKISPQCTEPETAGAHTVQAEAKQKGPEGAVLGLSMYERDLCFFEEQNRREVAGTPARMKRGGQNMTSEAEKSDAAGHCTGMGCGSVHEARWERSWCAAIEEGLAYYRKNDPLRADLFEHTLCTAPHGGRCDRSACTSAVLLTRKPIRTC